MKAKSQRIDFWAGLFLMNNSLVCQLFLLHCIYASWSHVKSCGMSRSNKDKIDNYISNNQYIIIYSLHINECIRGIISIDSTEFKSRANWVISEFLPSKSFKEPDTSPRDPLFVCHARWNWKLCLCYRAPFLICESGQTVNLANLC